MMTNRGNRLTHGQFYFLPDLTDSLITAQIKFALDNRWTVNVEFTDDPHPRNTYRGMFGMPMFDLKDPAGILTEINTCSKTFANHRVRVTAFDRTRGWDTPRMSYLVNRPKVEPGFRLVRQEIAGRAVRYTVESYAAQAPEGARYR